MQSGKYLASGLQSGHVANLIGVQYILQEDINWKKVYIPGKSGEGKTKNEKVRHVKGLSKQVLVFLCASHDTGKSVSAIL